MNPYKPPTEPNRKTPIRTGKSVIADRVTLVLVAAIVLFVVAALVIPVFNASR